MPLRVNGLKNTYMNTKVRITEIHKAGLKSRESLLERRGEPKNNTCKTLPIKNLYNWQMGQESWFCCKIRRLGYIELKVIVVYQWGHILCDGQQSLEGCGTTDKYSAHAMIWGSFEYVGLGELLISSQWNHEYCGLFHFLEWQSKAYLWEVKYNHFATRLQTVPNCCKTTTLTMYQPGNYSDLQSIENIWGNNRKYIIHQCPFQQDWTSTIERIQLTKIKGGITWF